MPNIYSFFHCGLLVVLSILSMSKSVATAATLDWDVESTHWFSPNEFNGFVADGPYVESGFKIEETLPSSGHVTPYYFALGDWGEDDPSTSYHVSRVDGNSLSLLSFDYYFDDGVRVESSRGGNVVVPGGSGTQVFSGPDWTGITYFTLTPVDQEFPYFAEGVIDSMELVPEPISASLAVAGLCLFCRRHKKEFARY